MKLSGYLFILLTLFGGKVWPLNIDEKKAKSSQKKEGKDLELEIFLQKVNSDLVTLRSELKESYAKVRELHDLESDEKNYEFLLKQINAIKSQISSLEEKWHDMSVAESKKDD